MMKRMHISSIIWIPVILFLVSCGNASEADRQNGIYIIPGEMRETAAVLTEAAETTASIATSAVQTEEETEARTNVQTEVQTTAQTEISDSAENIVSPETEVSTETEEEPPKQESAAQTKPVETDLNEGHTITDITVTSPIAPNSNAVLTAHVLPDTVYSITVYYSSGPSTAKGLTDKTSDADGTVSWEWKVGQRTKAGTYRIVITGGGDSAETTFTVTE